MDLIYIYIYMKSKNANCFYGMFFLPLSSKLVNSLGWCTRALIGLSFTSCPFGAPGIVSSGRILPTQRGESSAVDTEAWLCCSLLWDEVTVCKHNTVFHSYSRALDLIPW